MNCNTSDNSLSRTVTVNSAYSSALSAKATLIVVVPALTPVTTPLSSTVAIASSAEDHVNLELHPPTYLANNSIESPAFT
jgi:hypothetical protein